jgi:hypothetical protein
VPESHRYSSSKPEQSGLRKTWFGGATIFFLQIEASFKIWYYLNFVLDILNNQFYVSVVKIDLTEECFKPNKKNYERVIKCLLQNLKLEMDFIIAWNPPSETI